MRAIDTATRLCAVIGNPVGHSLSPAIHNAAFRALDLNYVYLAFEVSDAGSCLAGMRAMPSFRGMSVTIPHKLSVIPYLDEIEPLAEKVGSVNTIANDNGRLVGSTTDGQGALRAFSAADVDLGGRRVLFLGSGGAVRAVAFAMAEDGGAESLRILGRTASKVDALVGDLRTKTNAQVDGGDLVRDLAGAMEEHDVIVHGTPVGMDPDGGGESCVPRARLRSDHVVFDMVYQPRETRLLLDAKGAGCKTIPGIEMLLQQAALQFETWTGMSAPLDAMRAAV